MGFNYLQLLNIYLNLVNDDVCAQIGSLELYLNYENKLDGRLFLVKLFIFYTFCKKRFIRFGLKLQVFINLTLNK